MYHCVGYWSRVGSEIISVYLEYQFFSSVSLTLQVYGEKVKQVHNIGKILMFGSCVETSSHIIFNLKFLVCSKQCAPKV